VGGVLFASEARLEDKELNSFSTLIELIKLNAK
jgi:hypothetical protein